MIFVFKILKSLQVRDHVIACMAASGNRLLVFNDETADRSRRLDM